MDTADHEPTTCAQFIGRIVLTGSLDPLVELIKLCEHRPYSIESFIELYLCLQKDLYSCPDMRKIARNLRNADKLIVELYCTLNPQLGTAFLLEAAIYEIRTGNHILIPFVRCLSHIYALVCQPLRLNGHLITNGQYESWQLAAKILGALHAPEMIIKYFADNCEQSNAMQVAFNSLKLTKNAPADLVEAYRSHLLLRPIPIRASPPPKYSPHDHDMENYKRKREIRISERETETDSDFDQFCRELEAELQNTIIIQRCTTRKSRCTAAEVMKRVSPLST